MPRAVVLPVLALALLAAGCGGSDSSSETTAAEGTTETATSAAAPELNECDNATQGPQNTSRWVANGGPTVEPGREFGPPITNPEIWYSYRDNNTAFLYGTPCFDSYGPSAPPARSP